MGGVGAPVADIELQKLGVFLKEAVGLGVEVVERGLVIESAEDGDGECVATGADAAGAHATQGAQGHENGAGKDKRAQFLFGAGNNAQALIE